MNYELGMELAEAEVSRLSEVIERARNMAYELYVNREGLEEDGERLSDLHNVLSDPPVAPVPPTAAQVNRLYIDSPGMCPTCKLAVYINPTAISSMSAIGTYTMHGHVTCPCGWWVETGAGDNPLTIGETHAITHCRTSAPPVAPSVGERV